MPSLTGELRHEAIEDILAASGRATLPLRLAFLQGRDDGGAPMPGPLAAFVRRGRAGALDQLLLLRAWASAAPFDVRRSAALWAQLLDFHEGAAGERAVTRNWSLLVAQRQVRVQRDGRLARVTVLREDGSGHAYAHPGLAGGEPYLQLPYAYWRAGWDTRLTLPAKALLLIALTLADGFWLPAARAPEWYGISPSTAERALRELRRRGILNAVRARKSAPRTAAGYTVENRYTLRPPFGPKRIAAAGAPEADAGAQGPDLLLD